MFQDIGFEYQGERKVIKANKVFETIKSLTKVITLGQLIHYAQNPIERDFTHLTEAYMHLLGLAGYRNLTGSDRDIIFCELFNRDDPDHNANAVIEQLMAIMTPPDAVAKKIEKASSGQKKMEESNQTY